VALVEMIHPTSIKNITEQQIIFTVEAYDAPLQQALVDRGIIDKIDTKKSNPLVLSVHSCDQNSFRLLF
jgi:hypothetical protein